MDNQNQAEERTPHYLMQFFNYEHLPKDKQEVSKNFAVLAEKIDKDLPNSPEKSTALRKLLEAKECAVRALFFQKQ